MRRTRPAEISFEYAIFRERRVFSSNSLQEPRNDSVRDNDDKEQLQRMQMMLPHSRVSALQTAAYR